MKREGVWPAGCDNVEKGGEHGMVEGLKDFDKYKLLVHKDWVDGGVRGEVVVDALGW
jgi:hypothetical protein